MGASSSTAATAAAIGGVNITGVPGSPVIPMGYPSPAAAAGLLSAAPFALQMAAPGGWSPGGAPPPAQYPGFPSSQQLVTGGPSAAFASQQHQQSEQHEHLIRSIRVNDVPSTLGVDLLASALSETYGKVLKCILATNTNTQPPTCYALVSFVDESSAVKAVEGRRLAIGAHTLKIAPQTLAEAMEVANCLAQENQGFRSPAANAATANTGSIIDGSNGVVPRGSNNSDADGGGGGGGEANAGDSGQQPAFFAGPITLPTGLICGVDGSIYYPPSPMSVGVHLPVPFASPQGIIAPQTPPPQLPETPTSSAPQRSSSSSKRLKFRSEPRLSGAQQHQQQQRQQLQQPWEQDEILAEPLPQANSGSDSSLRRSQFDGGVPIVPYGQNTLSSSKFNSANDTGGGGPKTLAEMSPSERQQVYSAKRFVDLHNLAIENKKLRFQMPSAEELPQLLAKYVTEMPPPHV
eukprot:UC1_evm2s1457